MRHELRVFDILRALPPCGWASRRTDRTVRTIDRKAARRGALNLASILSLVGKVAFEARPSGPRAKSAPHGA